MGGARNQKGKQEDLSEEMENIKRYKVCILGFCVLYRDYDDVVGSVV